MTASILIDTNVLAYCYDSMEPDKALRAAAVCDQIARRDSGTISTQVVCELYNVLAVRMRDRVPAESVTEALSWELSTWRLVGVTPEAALAAVEQAARDGLSIWDAQLLATARYYRIPTVLSEGFAHRRDYDGVTVLNPFAEDFDVAGLV